MAIKLYTSVTFTDNVMSEIIPAMSDLWLDTDIYDRVRQSWNTSIIGTGTYPLFTTDGYHARPDTKYITFNNHTLQFNFSGRNAHVNHCSILLDGVTIFQASPSYSSTTCAGLWFAYDDVLEQIDILLVTGGANTESDYYISKHGRVMSQSNSAIIKSILDSVAPVSYQWQSVPSISGKNGILSLVTLDSESINDGEPVSEATVLSFDSLGNINIPSVIDEQMPVDPSDVTSVTATYLIPALENGTYEGIKLLVKKGSIPTSEEDADKVVNLDEPTSILRIDSKSVGNLDEDSHYYFVVKLVDEIGTEATSDPKDIWTSHNEGWSFDYTGSIQTFTAPKTGIYSLETWGAQGGDATDGTLTARGGYGAYAVGEVFLAQGETIYVNVGGQNGYGGGGINE